MKVAFVLIHVALTHLAYSQNIVDLSKELSKFKNVPTSLEDFESALEIYNKIDTTNIYQEFQLKIVDIKNGYLKGMYADGDVTICYWNMTSGIKLMCSNIWYCGPVCGSYWTFYEYSKENGIKESRQRIKLSDFITKQDYFDFEKMKAENTSSDFARLKSEADLTSSLILPQSGKNVTLYFEPILEDAWVAENLRYKVNYKGIHLIWKDGEFVKGNWIK